MESKDFLNYPKPFYILMVTGEAEVLKVPVYSPELWWWNKPKNVIWSDV